MSPTSYRTAPPRAKTFRNVVGLGRFELPTSRLSGVRSNQLSYRPVSLLCRFRPQKRATLPFTRVRFVLTVNRLEGPCSFGGLLDYCLRSTFVSFDFERSTISNVWFDL